jgi:hypothetical protein
MERVRVLAMDHFSDQDLRALEAEPRLDVRRFPYQRFRQPAIRIMGRDVARGLHAYNNPDIAAARVRYAIWLRREVERLYLERAFDVILLPSDTFFYVRSLPYAAHALGIPVVVMQKETTISIHTMEQHSQEMRAEAPFIADWMTVCSERHREFWIRAGANGDLVEVTGQPRFDIYASRRSRSGSARRRQILFLTNELDAYVPGVGQGMGLRTWEPLRDATERALFEAVRRGSCEVLVKIHPQQNHRAESARIERRAGDLSHRGVDVAPPDADTRELIVAADAVVGFQSTALYEAVAAARPVIYAAWGEEYERFRTGLIPFDQADPACVHHARSADELSSMLSDGLPAAGAACTTWYEEALGPVDGHATDRVTHRLTSIVAASIPTARRSELERRRVRFAVGLLARAVAAQTVWTVAIPVANSAGESRRVAVRRHRASEKRRLAIRTLRHGPH